jgi:hypothetical protein
MAKPLFCGSEVSHSDVRPVEADGSCPTLRKPRCKSLEGHTLALATFRSKPATGAGGLNLDRLPPEQQVTVNATHFDAPCANQNSQPCPDN